MQLLYYYFRFFTYFSRVILVYAPVQCACTAGIHSKRLSVAGGMLTSDERLRLLPLLSSSLNQTRSDPNAQTLTIIKQTQNYHMLVSGWPLSRQCEIPWRFAALGMLSFTHIMPLLVLLSVVGVGMQQGMICNHIFHI